MEDLFEGYRDAGVSRSNAVPFDEMFSEPDTPRVLEPNPCGHWPTTDQRELIDWNFLIDSGTKMANMTAIPSSTVSIGF